MDAPTPRALPAPATDAAAALLDELVRQGLADVVLSPGSRSQSLALVAAALERAGRIRLHVRIDERVAGFTALGLSRESGVPTAVICTSGTAAANLLPAAAEAHHAGVPLLLLTADRPPELRGVGANQTMRQPGMYAPNVRFETDAPVPEETDDTGEGAATLMLRRLAEVVFHAALGAGTRSAGPVHINLPLREPLAGELPPWFPSASPAPPAAGERPSGEEDTVESGALYQGGGGIGTADVAGTPADDPHVLERGPRTVVIAGADAGAVAEAIAHEGGWPLVAEIVSGARFGRQVIPAYRAVLGDPERGGRVQRAVVFGHPTLSREVVALLSRTDVEVIAVRGPGEPLGLNGTTIAADAVAVATGETDRTWLGEWLSAGRAASIDLDPPAPDRDGLSSTAAHDRRDAVAGELAAVRRPLDRAALVDAVWRATWPHDRLMFGSSRLVRVADDLLPGKKVTVHANRGLAGIDGTIATATGVALASQSRGRAGVTRLVLGDLAFLHDVGALLHPPGETEPRLQVIVGNDGGGTIFDTLEVAARADDADRTRVLYTPHTVRLEHLASAYGWEYTRVTTRSALDQVLLSPVGGRQIIEVPLDR